MHATIADAKADGKTHAVLQCRCGMKWVPLGLLPACPDDSPFLEIAARYRCQRCKERPQYAGCINPRTDIKRGGY